MTDCHVVLFLGIIANDTRGVYFMLVKKNIDMTPYDMVRRPCKQYPFLLPLVWAGSYLLTRKFGLKISKELRGVKPPYLIFSTHQGFSDYYVGPLSMFPHRCMYVSDMEGYAAFGNWLYRGLGCIPKRRYVPDINVVKHIKYSLDKKQSVMIFPESRHSNIGTTAYIPGNIGRLAKMMGAPVVVLSVNGSYLANPFWDEERTRKVRMKAGLTCLYTKEELSRVNADEIQKGIEAHLQYDEYKYQQDSRIKINESYRAEGLHKPLYQCRRCKTKYKMASKGAVLSCAACNTSWILNEDGMLTTDNSSEKIHIPDWYEWERSNTIAEAININREYIVRIEALPNEKGFIDLGGGKLNLNKTEFVLSFDGDKDWQKKIIDNISKDGCLVFKHCGRESLQTEYNYRGKGMCVVLSTNDCCYYIYSNQEDFNPTELQFISEYFYQKNKVTTKN